MDARSEFLVYMGASLTTIVVLFTCQIWYESYLDVAVVHAQNLDAPADAKLEAVRSAESGKLGGAAVPIEQAMRAVAERGRGASSKLAAQPSDDLSAMSGWVHRPGFAAYQPRTAPAPEAPAAATTDGDVVPAEGSAVTPDAPVPAAAEKVPTKVIVGVAKPASSKPKTPAPAPAAAPSVP